MADEKKLNELTEEELDNAAGGVAIRTDFKCDGCGKDFSNTFCHQINGKRYCPTCYTDIRLKDHYTISFRP